MSKHCEKGKFHGSFAWYNILKNGQVLRERVPLCDACAKRVKDAQYDLETVPDVPKARKQLPPSAPSKKLPQGSVVVEAWQNDY